MKPLIAIVLVLMVTGQGQSQSKRRHWSHKDAFDNIVNSMSRVNDQNCEIMHAEDLHLPEDSVSHVPVTKELGTQPLFPNRTGLLQVHNMALSRGIFFSFILQKAHDDFEPGLLYHYMSVISDVAANRVINASATYFSPNMSFTPSYQQFFNKTMPLFAPRAYRADDFNDPVRLQKISTLNTIVAADLGAVPNNSKSMNYSHEMYRINRWFGSWLPDKTKRQDSKITYNVDIAYGNGTNTTFVFHGPPAISNVLQGPVKWFDPYFDCKRSNKWLVGGTTPIVDRYARHTQFMHIEFPTYVAESVIETDYQNIDINQCPVSKGNSGKNIFADTAICKGETTQCEPIHGFGLRRGGYQCRCKPGYRLPRSLRSPYLGEIIERAPPLDYENQFYCRPIGFKMVLIQDRAEVLYGYRRDGNLEKAMRDNNSDHWSYSWKIDPQIITDYIKNGVTQRNCHNFAQLNPEKLQLPADISYGKEVQLENEARMALRLAHFISGFLQIRKPNARYAQYRLTDKPLSEDQLIGEVLSIVMGNFRIEGAGVYFDTNKFSNRTTFAPYAYRTEKATRNFNVIDLTRVKDKRNYVNANWFKALKTRWSTSTDDLEEYIAKMNIRFNASGEYSVKFDDYPARYRAAELRHGHWTPPYFDCGGFHDKWIVTYAAPFFGWDKIRHKLEFKGAVTTSVKLEQLDINQCEDSSGNNNAFKGTNKCDQKSTWCMPILGRGFLPGGYKCECQQGYEYPYQDLTTYFDGQIVESEFDRLYKGDANKYDSLKCRIAGAAAFLPSIALLPIALLSSIFYWSIVFTS